LLVVGCGREAGQTVVERVVEIVIVEKEVVVEKEKPVLVEKEDLEAWASGWGRDPIRWPIMLSSLSGEGWKSLFPRKEASPEASPRAWS